MHWAKQDIWSEILLRVSQSERVGLCRTTATYNHSGVKWIGGHTVCGSAGYTVELAERKRTVCGSVGQ